MCFLPAFVSITLTWIHIHAFFPSFRLLLSHTHLSCLVNPFWWYHASSLYTHSYPHLSPTRSLGDAVAHTAGVISDPEFTERELDPNTDRFLVIATDGLWEFVDNQETVDFTENQLTPTDAVDVLVKESSMRWMREEQVIDDTTIIVANLFNYKTK